MKNGGIGGGLLNNKAQFIVIELISLATLTDSKAYFVKRLYKILDCKDFLVSYLPIFANN